MTDIPAFLAAHALDAGLEAATRDRHPFAAPRYAEKALIAALLALKPPKEREWMLRFLGELVASDHDPERAIDAYDGLIETAQEGRAAAASALV